MTEPKREPGATPGAQPGPLSGAKADEARPKKPYARPAVVFREPLEAIAAVCSGQTAKGNPGICPKGPISS